MALKDWKEDKGWEKGYAYSSPKKQILISEGQFGGYNVSIWAKSPYKSLHRRNFRTFKLAQNYVKSYMRRN